MPVGALPSVEDGRIDYSTYSRAELLSALRAVDKAAFPRNHANLLAALGPLDPGEDGLEPPRPTWLRLLAEGLAELARSPRSFARLLGLPGLLMLLFAALAPPTNGEWPVLAITPWVALFLVVAFRVHRCILTPGAAAPGLRSCLRYLAWGLVLVGMGGAWVAAVMSSLQAPAALLPLFLLLPAVVYVGTRVSLILPDRAVGGTASLREVWAWSAGRGWWLVALLGVPGLAGDAVAALVGLLIGPARLAASVSGVLVVVAGIYEVAVLTCAYRALRPAPADHAPHR